MEVKLHCRLEKLKIFRLLPARGCGLKYGSEKMLVLITYDVSTEDAGGRRRLRQIAKQCVNYGQRVQCSVFECLLDAAQCRSLQAKLCKIMDPQKDSLRFYYLGNHYENKIEHFGAKTSYSPEDTLIL